MKAETESEGFDGCDPFAFHTMNPYNLCVTVSLHKDRT